LTIISVQATVNRPAAAGNNNRMQKTAIISAVIIVALSVSALAEAGKEKALIYNLSIKK
jgi:hypothetical protein